MTSIAVAIDVDSSRVFAVGDITYRFSQNMSFDSMQVNETNLMLNGVWFVIETEGHVNLTINKFVDVNEFNFTYNVTAMGTVFFNLSGYNFQREYTGGEDLIVLEKNTNSSSRDTLDTLTPFMDIFPIMIIVIISGMALMFIMTMFRGRNYY